MSPNKLITLFTFFLPISIFSQSLSIDQAIEKALSKNYGILISKNESVIAKNNNNIGNAGFLPDVNLVGSDNYNVSDTKQQFFTGEVRERSNAKSNTLTGSALLSWKIFDGFNMFVTREQLSILQSQGEINLKKSIEGTIAEVISTYYEIALQQEKEKTIQSIIGVSAERKKIAGFKSEIGSGSELEFLRAGVDLNADSSALLKQQLLTKNAKRKLKILLGASIPDTFSVDQKIIINPSLVYDDLSNKMKAQNADLLLINQNLELSNLETKSIRSLRYPTLNLNAGYNYTQSASEVGIIQSSTNQGMVYGASLNFNIFNGFRTNTQAKNARLGYENSKLAKEEMELELETNLQTLFQEYRNSLTLVKLEEKNINAAKQNMTISLEKFKLGSINSVEMRVGQNSYIEAQNRLSDEQFIVKRAETELLRLSGQLVK